MTATQPGRAASPVRSTSSSSTQLLPPCSAWPPLACLHKRREKLCQTDLPVRSAPGVWLLVGVGVVLVGMCVAVAGYASASSGPKPLQGGRGTSHADRMKLAGPVVMGVGLFIFICSATLLYENRDSALLTLRPEPGDGDPMVVDEEEGRSPLQPPCCREPDHSHHHHSHHHRHHHHSGDPELQGGAWGSSLSLAPSPCDDHGDDDGDYGAGHTGSHPQPPGGVTGSSSSPTLQGAGGEGSRVLELHLEVHAAMKRTIFFGLAVMLLPCIAHGEEEDDQPQVEEELLECFRCDLGLWDACYTTTVYCLSGESCFTGRGKAAGLLEVKTQGCVRTEECGRETTLELYPNATVYTVTKHCCQAPLCNAANTPAVVVSACSYLTGPVLSLWYLTGAWTRLH
ncbi:hypothetical protein NHX12_001651 [Muraenolepis orangiensis]|uniref:UPAR/Ly6 domain-containing protein n=1 Tax=Muraenolepis orangiensis TaxID=630683 RepID=A0A9Q0IF56_9TELE|nr:hypothetical protein NHX12_001651 [Muraenolepis orangiensis]